MEPKPQTASRLTHLPIALFAIVMGLSGLTIAWQKALTLETVSVPYVSDVLLTVTAFVFTMLLGLYLFKLFRHTDAVTKELHNPVKLNFFPAISISLLLLSVAFLPVDQAVSKQLWLMGTGWHLLFTLYVVNAWMHHEHFQVQHINPAWFIPAVGNLVVPLAGVPLGFVEISWFFFSIGLVFWLVLLTIVFYRLMFHSPLDDKLLPTLFILIAPPAVGFLSYYRLVGEIDAFARVSYYTALFMTLVLLTQLPRFARLRFALSWWAYSFPLAAISVASMAMYEQTGRGIYGWLGAVLLAVLAFVVGLLSIRTVNAAVNHRICVAETG